MANGCRQLVGGLRSQKTLSRNITDGTTMKSLRVGDWVRTACGDEGQIDLLSRLSAYLEFGARPHRGPPSCLQSELTKIDPPDCANSLSAILPD